MVTVGELVEEAIGLLNSGSHELAFVPTARAIEATAAKALEKDAVYDLDIDRYISENWQLISFMGMPRALPLPMNIPFGLKRIIPTFNVHHGAKEIVTLVVTKTLAANRMPKEFSFDSADTFEIQDGRLLLPLGLARGLLGSVIFHTANKGEAIGEEYWISIGDFRMFVSELFGRADLAERIMRFYNE